MYGRVEYLAEGAVDEVLKSILRHGDGPLKLDHYHHRYPLHVEDAARAVYLLLNRRVRMVCTRARACSCAHTGYNNCRRVSLAWR
jgi:hypothetical protein